MANQKVPQLPILTAITDADLFYVVDVSDTTDDPTGSSKQVTREEILTNVSHIDFNLTAVTSHEEGRVSWNDSIKSLEIDTENPDVQVQVGHEMVVRVNNQTGSILTKGTVVYINGAQGQRPTVTKADYSADTSSASVIGLVAADINNGENGYVVTQGILEGLDTTAYSAGTSLYLFTGGTYSSNKPQAPDHDVRIGKVIVSNATTGSIYVNVQNGYELDELHDVRITSATTNDMLVRSSYNGIPVWVNTKTLSGLTYVESSTISATTISATIVTVSGNSSSDLVRITQTGSGNALVVEDENNPDSSPFIVNASGFVGVGTYSPLSKFVVSNNNSEGIEMGYSAGLTSNYIESFNRNTGYGVDMTYYISNTGAHRFYTNSTERVRIENSGNVIINNGLSANTISATTVTVSGNSSSDLVRITQTGSGNAFVVEDTTNPDSSSFVIDGSGSVGIGVNIPSAKLQVGELVADSNYLNRGLILQGGYSTSNIRKQNLMTFGAIGLYESNPLDDTALGYDRNWHIGILSDFNYFSQNRFSIINNGVEKLTILQSNGNVGIGTSTPSDKLTVNGTTLLGGVLNSTSGNLIIDHPGVNSWKFGVFTANTSTLSIGNDYGGVFANKVINITNDGLVGIGTTSPAVKLDVQIPTGTGNQVVGRFIAGTNTNGSAGGIALGSTQTTGGYIYGEQTAVSSGDLVFGVQNLGSYAERMRILSSGNIGIGTTSPTEKLHVSGNTIVSGTISGGTMVITSTPTTDNTNTQLLSRDTSTGLMEIVESTSLPFNYGLANAIMTGTFLT